MECSQPFSVSAQRDVVGNRREMQVDAKRELEKQLRLSGSSHNTSSELRARTRILRASDVLLSLAGRAPNDAPEKSPGIENFQEALRLFTPFRDDDGTTLGAVDSKCPDCDAVFSSSNELKQHYLTRFCPGAAIAIYVMTRDRLITKGYRMEKRLIPFESRPIRFFCDNCEQHFAMGDHDEMVDRQPNAPSFVDCKCCGEKCNISYEPILNDPRDDTSFRDIQKEKVDVKHSRSPSIAQRSFAGSKVHMIAGSGGEQLFARRTRRLRDSWSFRKLSQSEEDELIAISFSGLYDLERVHAPNGVFQQFEGNTKRYAEKSSVDVTLSAHNGTRINESKKLGLAFCEDESAHSRSDLADSEGDRVGDDRTHKEPSLSSRRQSFLKKIFGRRVSQGLSRAMSTSNKGKKLIKRVNTVRFSFVPKNSRNGSEATTSEEGVVDVYPADATQSGRNEDPTAVSAAEYITLLRDSQNIFIHMQYLSGGAMVHDASGRQRILQMDEVADLFLRMKDGQSAATTWSQTLSTRMRADAALKQGNSRAAVVEYHDALRVLESTPALDVDKLLRASILQALGKAYRNLDMPAESEACYLESLGLYRRSFGRDHPQNFTVLHELGSLCEKDGYATEAAALYERSFAGRMKTLGHNAPETLSSMQDLASLKVLLGDLESALLLLEKAVPALDTVFGLQNETTLNAMNKLSLLYQKLGLDKESRAICARTIPHCKTLFGITSPVTRDAVVRYLQSSENFDFPPEIKDIIDQYRCSRDPDSLRVIHRLGRSYMDAGLNRNAADLFETLVEDFLAIKGPEAPETFDALSALCVSREHLDSVDKAILAYKQLVHMANRTPDDHHSRKRIAYAEKRILDLNRRREILAAERKEWGLHEPGPCEHCGGATTVLCNTCNIFRFCSEFCHKSGIQAHFPCCVPSVSLRESKSLAVKPKCPASTRDQVLSKIHQYDSNKSVNVTASYTFYLDPRNFATFRMKLSSVANTVILFSVDSDIQYAIIDNPPTDQRDSTHASASSLPTNSSIGEGDVQWLTPGRQEAICYTPSDPSQSRYVLVAPGKEMLKSVIDKRISARGGGGEKECFQSLKLPDNELIEYAQGLLLTGYLGEAFMYVIEWVWK